MRKLLNDPKVVATLVVGAIAVVGYQWLMQGSKHPNSFYAGEETTYDEDVSTVALRDPLPAFTPPDGLRDPFQDHRRVAEATAAAQADPVHAPFRLTAVWLQGEDQFAVLNGRICRPGDTVHFVTVEKVTREGVWLRSPGTREFVSVGRELVLLAPATRLLTPPPLLASAHEP